MPFQGYRRSGLVPPAANLVPLAILLVFVGVILAVDPWPPDHRAVAVAVGLVVVPGLVLGLATAVVARLLQEEEHVERS